MMQCSRSVFVLVLVLVLVWLVHWCVSLVIVVLCSYYTCGRGLCLLLLDFGLFGVFDVGYGHGYWYG